MDLHDQVPPREHLQEQYKQFGDDDALIGQLHSHDYICAICCPCLRRSTFCRPQVFAHVYIMTGFGTQPAIHARGCSRRPLRLPQQSSSMQACSALSFAWMFGSLRDPTAVSIRGCCRKLTETAGVNAPNHSSIRICQGEIT